MAICADEDVFGFEISVDDARGVKTFNTFDDFGSVESCAISAEATPSCKLSCKVTTWVEVLNTHTKKGDIINLNMTSTEVWRTYHH